MGLWTWLGLPDKKDILELRSEMNSLREENKVFQEQNQKLFKHIEESDKRKLDSIINEVQSSRERIEDGVSDVNKHMEQMYDFLNASQKDIIDLQKQINTRISECIGLIGEGYNVAIKNHDGMRSILENSRDSMQKNIEAVGNDITEKIQKKFESDNTEKNVLLDRITESSIEIEKVLFKIQNQIKESHQNILDNNQLINAGNNQVDKIFSDLGCLDKKINNLESIQETLSSLAESVKYLWSIMKAVWVDSTLSDIESLEGKK